MKEIFLKIVNHVFDSQKRPERLRSSTRLVLVMFSVALIRFVRTDKITGEQFMTAVMMIFMFFFKVRRQDGTLPEEKKPE